MEFLTQTQRENLELNTLSEDKKRKILEIKNNINLKDESIIDFGSAATKNLSDFSSTMLKTIKLKDFPEIETIVGSLMQELQKVDSNTLLSYKPSPWKKFFRINDLERFLKDFASQFDSVSDVITSIKVQLEDSKYQLTKDLTLCDQYLDQNLKYINELDEYIFAGNLKIKELEIEVQNDLDAIDPNDTLAVNMLNMKQDAKNRFEMNLHDLSLIRENAVQNMYHLQLIKKGDSVLIEKIKKSIEMAIPLWESQMLVAFIVARQQNCINLEKAISDTTNNLITMNSELVKEGAIKIAMEVQRGVIDLDVLKESSKKLIETFDEVNKITIEGKKERMKAIQELKTLSVGLNEATLLEAKQKY